MEDAYAKSAAEVLAAFRVDRNKGLSDAQVEQHARLYGKNDLPQEESTPFWKLVLKQFDDLLVIFMILAANAAVGVITETNAEKALEELRAYQADAATVLRNGCFSILPATELVPGDIVEVGVGCKVPADMRTIEMLSHQFRVDQAILTA
ncbi:hypothetical protein GUJ93_ZPchr0007g4192 [Zizania palustris]|uniref:Cation-transporting P-type ATPase N-terminal domain-containing protein n=1 Tax=Zizania palustris TaxID=103762 RepID=A0A8J5SUZ7_ZIZPA|nr:hypothetical protein GUJ93_ZPchr0007g4192 [Zizania palustris]